MEEDLTLEIKEKVEDVAEGNWSKYLAITTAIIAVLAALASLQSGTFSNEALLEKNNAILAQSKESDQWNYYQAKGIKKNLADSFYQQTNDSKLKQQVDKYAKEQEDIQKQALDYQKQVEEANKRSEQLFGKHHKLAFAVTLFQIAISLSAITALLKKRWLWYLSILLTIAGIYFSLVGLI